MKTRGMSLGVYGEGSMRNLIVLYNWPIYKKL